MRVAVGSWIVGAMMIMGVWTWALLGGGRQPDWASRAMPGWSLSIVGLGSVLVIVGCCLMTIKDEELAQH